MAKPDLTTARRIVAGVMDATCTISRDAEGTGDDLLDEVTLERIAPVPDDAVVYSGPCLVTQTGTGRTTRSGALETTVGGVTAALGSFNVRLPHDAPEVHEGDVVTVDTSESDPQLVDVRLRVVEVVRTSMLVWRTLICEEVAP